MRDYYQGRLIIDVAKHFDVGTNAAQRMIREAGGTTHPNSRGGGLPPLPIIELPKEKITRVALAKRFGVVPATITDWAIRGYIPSHEVGGFTIYYEEEVAGIEIVKNLGNYTNWDNRPRCKACRIIFEEIGEPDGVVCSECGRLYKRSKDGWIAK